MNPRMHDSHTLDAGDGHAIPVYLWEPDRTPRGIIQIFHGLGEHAGRYARFANAACEDDYAVCAHDHRGHGPGAAELGFFAEHDGWQSLVTDGHSVTEFLRRKFPGLPILLLGHSMGSFIAQSYTMRFADELVALILSGSTWPSPPQLLPGRWLARIISWFRGRHGKSPMLDTLGFGAFNKKFEPARTEFDWLSRDPAEVDKYVADTLCGGPYTIGLWLDFLGGLLQLAKLNELRRIPADLPILITGGADDPVGGETGMRTLAARYEKTRHPELTMKIYVGGRHEMLNETNRDEFTNDVLRWIAESLSNHQT